MKVRPHTDVSTADLLLLLLIVWLCFNWYQTISHVVRYYNPLPIGDYWRVVENYEGYRNLDLAVFWRQHNEHRIVFPEIVFALDALAFHGREMLPLICSFVCYVAGFGVITQLVWPELPSLRTKIAVVLVGGITAGWAVNSLVLGVPFLLQWTLLQFAVTCGLVSVFRLRESAKSRYLIASVCCGILATYSSANGMLLWPVMILIAIVLRLPWRHILVYVLAGISATSVYFVGYHKSPVNLLQLIKQPGYCVGFVLSYVSMPFGVLRNPWIGLTFGFIAVCAWAILFVQAIRKRRALRPVHLISLGYFVFVLLSGLMTSLGRSDLGDGGFMGAKAGRYVTISLLAWAFLFQVALVSAATYKWRVFSPKVIGAIVLSVLLFMQVRLARWIRTNDAFVASQQWATLALENGIVEPELINSVFPSQVFIEGHLPLLREHRLSIYADQNVAAIGKPFRARVTKAREQKASMRAFPLKSGVAVIGWSNAHYPVMKIVNDSNITIAIGRRLHAGLPKNFLPTSIAPSPAWVGFLKGSEPVSKVRVYGCERDVCELVAFEYSSQ